MTEFRDRLAKQIRASVQIGPLGHNTMDVAARGLPFFLTPSEAEEVANEIVELVVDPDDYMKRLRGAVIRLDKLIEKLYDSGSRQSDASIVRLEGKIEGVKLALSYLSEELRRHE